MSRASVRELLLDDPGPIAMAIAAGVHGVYVHNALAAGEGDGFVVHDGGADVGLGWFGPRGNLVILGDEAAEWRSAAVRTCVDAILDQGVPWRLAMGPTPVIEALRERVPAPALLCRDQIYYVGHAGTAARDLVRAEMRQAQRGDRDRLVQATLLLNASDLNIDPARVDRRWLRDTIDERIAEGSTRVLGPVGAPACKLDIGSEGPGGSVLEGVFTFPEERGKGLAAAIVASCLAAARGAVSLHVGQHNRPARSAYERAGMHEQGRCRLLLLG